MQAIEIQNIWFRFKAGHATIFSIRFDRRSIRFLLIRFFFLPSIRSSVLLRILEQPFYPIFAHFSPNFQSRTTFSKSLKNLKHHRYIIQSLHHMIYSTNSSKSSQLNSISSKSSTSKTYSSPM